MIFVGHDGGHQRMEMLELKGMVVDKFLISFKIKRNWPTGSTGSISC